MNNHDQIIDVTPVNHSSTRIGAGQARPSRTAGQPRQAPGRGQARASASPLGGIAQMALGAGLVAVGIPMLILPGPGLLSIGAGVALAARGLGKVTGR